jgi:general secretion pathway protein F
VPLYRYEALDRSGNKVAGAMQVSDENTLTMRLVSMGYRPMSVQLAPGAGGRPAPTPVSAASPSGPVSNAFLNERTLARMYHQLHISFRAGMPAFQAVNTVAAQVMDPTARQVLSEIAVGVRDGNTVSGLMEHYPRVFSRGDVGMIRAAEMGGFLPEAMANLAARHEEDDNARRRLRIWVWFFHSNFIALLVMIAFAMAIPAGIASMSLAAAGAAFGRGLLFIGVPASALYFGGVLYLRHARHNPALAYRWHGFLLKLPLLKKLNHLRGVSVFTRALQQLYHAGVNPVFAWETASGAVPNLVLAERFMAGRPVVESTGRLSLAMQQAALHDMSDVGMVATGESTGEIPQALHYLANRYEEETRTALGASVFRAAISFVAWAFIVFGIGIVAIAYGYYGQVFKAVDQFMGVG